MLYSESWKYCAQGINKIVLISLLLFITGCNRLGTGKNGTSSEEEIPICNFSEKQFSSSLSLLAKNDKVEIVGDKELKDYYTHGGKPLWVNEYGVFPVADSLVTELANSVKYGFSPNFFNADSLRRTIDKIREVEFSPTEDTLNALVTLEYGLTKAYLRYVTGQRYGFVNPRKVFNRLTVDKKDYVTGKAKSYKILFDVDVESPDSLFYNKALSNVNEENIRGFIRAQRPQSYLFDKLCSMLGDTAIDEKKRLTIACNIERCRWRGASPIGDEGKYVAVNIPAYHLYAHNGDSILDMRIGCGTFKNKTPQIVSKISWMEVNPVWIIPKSIIENEVSPHAGDTAYFARNRYSIIEKSTGDTIKSDSVTARMLKSGKYRIVQKGGVGNSLGRIVFRFPNNLAIYLHDTSTKAFFKRERRGVSHGCVRIQKPFEFAEYLLETDDDWLLDKLRISMDIKPKTDRGKEFVKENEGDDLKLVKRLNVEPKVPVFILYYTIYPDHNGKMTTYPDVYDYDEVLSEIIKPLVF